MQYRREIDGLRALAVMAVLVFHFFPSVLPYGYIGVDLFFVISGFLISVYILEESKKNSFSFKTFYIRRVKRILPVTMAMLAVTFVAAFFIFTENDFNRFLKSLIATLFFVANIFFWRDGGYFGSEDSLKPLLHMWSLSVEEQFYLAFPLFFFFFLKFIKLPHKRLLFLSITIAFAFMANYWLIRSGGSNPAFFLSPFRVWEFGAGALAAVTYHHFNRQHSQLTLILSLTAILSGMFFLPDFLAPGFLVVLGSAYFLSQRYTEVIVVDNYFTSHTARAVGLISFSLYLWHWPILAFFRYVSIDEISIQHALLGMILTFVLSFLSYRFVEQPFRKTVPVNIVFNSSFGLALVLVVASAVLLKTGMSTQKDNPVYTISSSAQTNFRCNLSDYIAYGASRACFINKEIEAPYDVAIVGNSHAQMYVPAMQKILKKQGKRGLLIPLNGCLPTINLNISVDCLKMAKLNYDAFMADKNIKTVVIALTWYADSWVTENGEKVKDADKSLLTSSLVDLVGRVRASGREVFLVGPIQTPNYDIPSVLSRKIKFLGLTDKEIEEALRVSRVSFDTNFLTNLTLLSESMGENFIRPSDELCDAEYCYLGDAHGSYFADSNHLSSYGVSRVEKLFAVVGKQEEKGR
jgi:peptidoglycan/LPS O-acetylase OafA/YrhL